MWPFTSRQYPVRTPEEVANQTFDYIVIGGGTAGCVVASRLSEDPTKRVLLLERGPVIDTWASRVPLLSVNNDAPAYAAYQWSSVGAGAPHRLVTGKALGGTARINMHLYTRSVPGEYNAWAAAGRVGWAWDDVEPYFRRSEKSLSHGDEPHRGSEGVWKNRGVDELLFDSVGRTIDAAKDLDMPYADASNDPSAPPNLCSRVDLTMDEWGRRCSTFDAFLPYEVATQRQQNLYICTGVVVSKLNIEKVGTGLRALGVHFVKEGGSPSEEFYASASGEIILSGGAIISPQILMLSGVGPAKHLHSHGIDVIKDLPGVGSHLQDHLGIPIIFHCPRKDSMFALLDNKLWAVWELLKYIFFARGIFLFPNPQMFIFAHSRLLDEKSHTVFHTPEDKNAHLPENIPDIEIMHIATAAWNAGTIDDDKGAMSYLSVLLRPKSVGTVRLKTKSPFDRPDCDLAYFSNTEDYEPVRKVVRLALAMGRKVKQSGYPLEEFFCPETESDADIDDFARKTVRTTYHYTSTCRMAPESEGGVVDDELRVYGIEGLRIADASIFPTIPACHTQAPTVMVAERCADFVKGGRT